MVEMEQERIEMDRRSTPPGHYTFKIESFSLLSEILLTESSSGNYESPEFEASGHKWRLSLYPNGNKKQGGDDYISLYLVLADSDAYTFGSEVTVMFNLFIFDQTRDKFLIIRDGKARRFHAMKKEWGVSRLISLKTFKDVSNGYLVDDSCVFGVEVFAIPSVVKAGSFALIKEPSNGTFSWKIKNFSMLADGYYYSKPFTVGGHQWKLMVDPKGEDGDYFSLFLQPHNVWYPGRSKIYVEYTLITKDQVHDNHQKALLSYWFSGTLAFGCDDFLPLSELKDKTRGFIVNDCVHVEVQIHVISKTTPNIKSA